MAVVIGIDGGGTKTKAIMANNNGEILATAIAGPSNPNAISANELEQTIRSIFFQLHNENQTEFQKVQFCFAGMAGAGEGNIRNAIHEVIEKVCREYDIPFQIHNDGVNALFAGTYGEPGIVLISGTGSIAYGMSKDGHFHRVGGWGYLFDDLGSGYDLGRAALMAVFQAFDGRGEETLLTNLLKKYFQVEDIPSIVPKVYQHKAPRSIIAPISHLVFDAYDNGDFVAKKIIDRAGEELSRIVQSMQKRLNLDEHQNIVFVSGGIFNRLDVLERYMLKHFSEPINFQRLQHEPVVGAVVAALKQLNLEITCQFKKNISNIND